MFQNNKIRSNELFKKRKRPPQREAQCFASDGKKHPVCPKLIFFMIFFSLQKEKCGHICFRSGQNDCILFILFHLYVVPWNCKLHYLLSSAEGGLFRAVLQQGLHMLQGFSRAEVSNVLGRRGAVMGSHSESGLLANWSPLLLPQPQLQSPLSPAGVVPHGQSPLLLKSWRNPWAWLWGLDKMARWARSRL